MHLTKTALAILSFFLSLLGKGRSDCSANGAHPLVLCLSCEVGQQHPYCLEARYEACRSVEIQGYLSSICNSIVPAFALRA